MRSARGLSSVAIAGIILGVVLLCAVIGLVLYSHSPRYATEKLMTAIANKDAIGFDRWVNTDMVAKQVVDTAIARVKSASGGGGNGLLGGLMANMLDKRAAQFQETVKSGMLKHVQDGNFSWDELSDLETKPLADAAAEFLSAQASTYKGIDHIGRDAGHAEVTVQYETASGLKDVTLVFRRAKGSLEVIGVKLVQ